MNKALFLDRDGIINEDKGYVHKIDDFKFVDGIFQVLKVFQNANYMLIIITNQAGIARGFYTEEDFFELNNWMLLQLELKGIQIKKVFFDPTHPENGIGHYKMESCDRKPNPGMIFKAQKEYNLDLQKSVLLGDKDSDILAGINAGVGMNFLLTTSNYIDELCVKVSCLSYLIFISEYFGLIPNRKR